ncbi:MAG: calcium-binding protein [Leptolyngbyaceae cyanobacterium CSU_1_4]|nr:calcium-binding protein [Leptolyngbyaceae cyanobacterium CSU_1_4]
MFGGIADDQINGLAGNDLLFGDAGNDLLSGGTGIDTMRGGSGNDFYVVDVEQDQVIEEVDAGIDTVQSSARFTTLLANVENLDLIGNAEALGRGNELNNIINGSVTARNSLFGGGGDDILNGADLADRLFGEAGRNTLNGNGGNDELTGSTDDVMNGGNGDDLYIVKGNPTINEALNAGSDTVRSSNDFTLGANLENLILVDSGVNGTGNELNNSITGNAQNNILTGNAGDDALGARGNLINNFELGLVDLGDFGNDTLDGGIGNDNMAGGVGNDIYIVDSVGDVVIETVSSVADPENGFIFQGGIDTVQSSVNFTLGNLVENLTLTGGAALNGTGNSLNNTITGNGNANVLEGQAGNDSLLGQGGADVMRGGVGNDLLLGGKGKDVLTGGSGADMFVFDIGSSYNQAAIGKDVIKDFAIDLDRIVLDRTTFGNISKSDFAIVADNIDAATSSKLIVYSEATGKLFFNQNGSSAGFGQGGYFATLQGAPSLTANDIAIQA